MKEMHAGVNFKWPFFEKVVKKVSLKEQVVDFPPQAVITKDNVTMQIDTVVYFKINDARKYAYGVSNPMQAIENLTVEIANEQEKMKLSDEAIVAEMSKVENLIKFVGGEN